MIDETSQHQAGFTWTPQDPLQFSSLWPPDLWRTETGSESARSWRTSWASRWGQGGTTPSAGKSPGSRTQSPPSWSWSWWSSSTRRRTRWRWPGWGWCWSEVGYPVITEHYSYNYQQLVARSDQDTMLTEARLLYTYIIYMTDLWLYYDMTQVNFFPRITPTTTTTLSMVLSGFIIF